MNVSLYEHDFYAWANEQAALLRSGNLAAAEIERIAEEIESMGRSEKRELESRLDVLLLHLLKWRFQPSLRGNSWRLTIKEQRRKLTRHLEQNPSLKAELNPVIADAFGDALIEAERETGLPENAFPTTCPWSFETIMDADFWPGEEALRSDNGTNS
ncbi:DUF29 domain-containing protein [uncultured Gammaproteobacteria bacterium]